ncbi:response regulator [Tenacibaculum sp. ZS6-P6]|uniref:response regulator n=1 Tax=Tenacibaculum sp. ZS6-P6 TaxID=3447503 RepID=UPI003F9B0CE5
MKSSIYIADDHPILVKGLEEFLKEKKFNVIGTGYDGTTALNFILKNTPEIAILDIDMPKLSGIEIAKKCLKEKVGTKIILITLHKEIELYLQAKKLNIYGYLLKEFAIEEIQCCIESVLNNTPFFSSKIREVLNFSEEDCKILNQFSMAERRILMLVSQHKTNKEIGRLLFLSPRTIEKHRSKIILKLDLPPKTGALLQWTQKNKHIFTKSNIGY